MNIFQVVNYIYTKQDLGWIEEIGDDIAPIVVNRFLSMNVVNANICKYLNKYIFSLDNKMWVALAWSVIPKVSKAPFCKYIKSNEDVVDEFNFLWDKVKKKNNFYGNDYKNCKEVLINNFEENKEKWFLKYGIEKKYWKKYGLDINKMKEEINQKEIKTEVIKKENPKENVLGEWF